MTITRCDVCGADNFERNEMKKGKVIFKNRKKLIYIDLCPNCYKNGDTFYVEQKGAKIDHLSNYKGERTSTTPL